VLLSTTRTTPPPTTTSILEIRFAFAAWYGELASLGPHYFHYNTCQRCVKDFDHHRSIFGRCIIAGKLLGRQGNYKYFVAIIVVGLLAYWTAAVALIWSLSLQFDPKCWVIPVTLFGLWFLSAKHKEERLPMFAAYTT
jgi:hypothetical protein